jgi:hypothetical protein
LVTSQITVNKDRVSLVGAGRDATRIHFTPTANATCFSFSKGAASVLYETALKDMLIWSEDTTYTKTAVEIVDTSNFTLDNVLITGGTGFWEGGAATTGIGTGSICLKLNGREALTVRSLTARGDRPIVIGTNPNSTLSLDSSHFEDLYLDGRLSNPVIEVLNGVSLTNVIFDGFQAWVGGNWGFYWVDTTTAKVNYAISFQNVRTEQSRADNNYDFYISTNLSTYSLTFENYYGGADRKGIYLRNVRQGVIKNSVMATTTAEVLNMVAVAGAMFELDGLVTFASATASLTGFYRVSAADKPATNSPLPSHALYVYETSTYTDYPQASDVYIGALSGTLADDATVELRCAANWGFAIAEIRVAVRGATVSEGGHIMMSDQLGITKLSGSTNLVTTNTDTKLSVDTDWDSIWLRNRLGESVKYVVTLSAAKV